MADKFPSNIGSTPFSLADTFDRLRQVVGQVKFATQDLSTKSAAGPVNATAVQSYGGCGARQ